MSGEKKVEDLTAEMLAMRARYEAEGEKHQNEIAELKDLIQRLQGEMQKTGIQSIQEAGNDRSRRYSLKGDCQYMADV